MGYSRVNDLDQADTIAGSEDQRDNFIVSEEPLGYGPQIGSQSGSSASINSIIGDVVTITGLTGMTANSVGRMLTLSGSFHTAQNDGTFLIVEYYNPSTIDIINSNVLYPDAHSGSINWVERESYSLESDLNYVRTDRKNIKGTTNWYDQIPVYTRPTDTSNTNIPANLKNIAGKTTDAISYNINKSLFGAFVFETNTFITINSIGLLKHSDSNNKIGVPCFDKAPFLGDYESCYVHIVDGNSTGSEIKVLSGAHIGERIFGLTYAGLSTSPNSVEIHFYSSPFYNDYTINRTAYIWESSQVSAINILYAFNQRLDLLDINSLRSIPALGILTDISTGTGGNADFSKLIINTDGSLTYIEDGDLLLKA